jgi:hypothetical protein
VRGTAVAQAGTMTVVNRAVRHRASPAARVVALLQDWERRLGADRPGRSGLVWLGPLVSAAGAFVMLAWFAHSGGLGVEQWLPISLFGALILGGLSVSYLAAFAGDARDAEDRAASGGR